MHFAIVKLHHPRPRWMLLCPVCIGHVTRFHYLFAIVFIRSSRSSSNDVSISCRAMSGMRFITCSRWSCNTQLGTAGRAMRQTGKVNAPAERDRWPLHLSVGELAVGPRARCWRASILARYQSLSDIETAAITVDGYFSTISAYLNLPLEVIGRQIGLSGMGRTYSN